MSVLAQDMASHFFVRPTPPDKPAPPVFPLPPNQKALAAAPARMGQLWGMSNDRANVKTTNVFNEQEHTEKKRAVAKEWVLLHSPRLGQVAAKAAPPRSSRSPSSVTGVQPSSLYLCFCFPLRALAPLLVGFSLATSIGGVHAD